MELHNDQPTDNGANHYSSGNVYAARYDAADRTETVNCNLIEATWYAHAGR